MASNPDYCCCPGCFRSHAVDYAGQLKCECGTTMDVEFRQIDERNATVLVHRYTVPKQKPKPKGKR